MRDLDRSVHDRRAALEVRTVGVGRDEGFVVLAGVPVEEHLEGGGRFDGGAEVHFLEAVLLAQSGGDVCEDGGAGV